MQFRMSLDLLADLKFHGNNPGATKYGNFINYYSFHSCNERIKNLDPKMFVPFQNAETIVCLDIGCNTGELTVALKLYLQGIYPKSKIKVLAIDVDPTLIQRAKEKHSDNDILFVNNDILREDEFEIINMFLNSNIKVMFDIVFCFSVSMWIHINNGDEGLLKFLDFIKKNSRLIIIEPQPWKCYRSAQRRMKRSGSNFEYYDHLKFRNNVESIIEEIISKESHIKLYESPASSWNRKVISFAMQNIN